MNIKRKIGKIKIMEINDIKPIVDDTINTDNMDSIQITNHMQNLQETQNTPEIFHEMQTCFNIITDAFNEYNSTPYMIHKINHYIANLPIMLQKIVKEQEDKLKYREKMNEEKEYFISNFLQTHNYSYCHNTELFFNYDGLHFYIYNEDEIQYKILYSIRIGQKLTPIKHKIKSNIIKQIKDISPMTYIPESATIQFVINNLYPTVFKDKDSVKYFLTLLGDNILKKNEDLIYIISPNAKGICNEIFTEACNLLGITHLFNSIKYKYYDHSYSDCRLIMINDNISKYTLDKQFYKFIMDFFCVACHYSNRYQNADTFLNICNNKQLIDHTLYLKDNTLENITDQFIHSSLEKCNGSSVKWKNILYVWKMYLDKLSIPNIAFSSKLKSLLIQKLEYNESQDMFMNITSPLLPLVSNCLKFWEETMIKDETEYELEIGEICTLFKGWVGKHTYINEKTITDIIQHFYSDIQIEDEKYINQISCKLWDKKSDILHILETYKVSKQNCQYPDNINNLYTFYCTTFKHKPLIASKRYVEKCLIDLIGEHIDSDNLIMPTLWS